MTPRRPCVACRALLAAALLSGCDREPGNPAQTASTYTSDADSDATENARDGTRQGRMLEAPPKIQGVRVQLGQFRSGAPSQENLTAYKFALADLVSSMEADMMRLGASAEGPRIREARDSLLEALGGGTGPVRDLSPEELRQNVADVERLIRSYESIVNRSSR
jgi:hypothetical protein